MESKGLGIGVAWY